MQRTFLVMVRLISACEVVRRSPERMQILGERARLETEKDKVSRLCEWHDARLVVSRRGSYASSGFQARRRDAVTFRRSKPLALLVGQLYLPCLSIHFGPGPRM